MSGAKTAVRKLTNELINSAIYIYIYMMQEYLANNKRICVCVCVCDMYVCMYNKNLIRYHVIVKADYDRDNCL